MSNKLSPEEVCAANGSAFEPPHADEILGVALATLNKLPLNALRLSAQNGNSGWYIWGGELSQDPQFFQPLHVHHLMTRAPQMIPFLALAAGWRVLLAPDQTEVWRDDQLFDV
jgi:hypothetical protein